MTGPARTPVPPELARFVALFDAGEYWESHEALEGPWRHHRSGFYQGLIIIASGYVHLERENARGVRAQMDKAIRYLAPYPSTYLGFDVEGLLERAQAARRAAEAAEPGWTTRVPRFTLPFDPEKITGNEPELEDLTNG